MTAKPSVKKRGRPFVHKAKFPKIMKMLKSGKMSYREIAKETQVSKSTVWLINRKMAAEE